MVISKLDQCTDERTVDFTAALMEFADWHCNFAERAMAVGHNPPTTRKGAIVLDGVYLWPSFIVHMLERPAEWAAWRKKAERSARASPRRVAYLKSFIEDFQNHAAAFAKSNPAYVAPFLVTQSKAKQGSTSATSAPGVAKKKAGQLHAASEDDDEEEEESSNEEGEEEE